MATNTSNAPAVVEEWDGHVSTGEHIGSVTIGGPGGTVKVHKIMQIAGDLIVGQDLKAFGKVVVGGVIDLGGRAWAEATLEKKIYEMPIGNAYTNVAVPPAFAVRNQNFSEGFTASCVAGNVNINGDLTVDGHLYVNGNLRVRGRGYVLDPREIQQGVQTNLQDF